jgi:hypothetical protein
MVDYELDIAGLIAANEAERIRVPVVACGVGAGPREAADAIRAGAKEFIPLPPDAELIAAVLAAVSDDNRPMVARDVSMEPVIAWPTSVAGSDASILITGESGVGKEVLARYVHAKSRRSSPAVHQRQLRGDPREPAGSELFGHEKGAFTGAVARRIGKFEEADGGTLLLDEISEMDARLQAKLLRAMQEREIDRVGGTKPVKVDIRILATSNRDLAAAVKSGDLPRRPALPPERREPAPAAAARPAGRRARPGRALHQEVRRRQRRAGAAAVGRGQAPPDRTTAGPATCVSSKTPCTARCCWPAATRSARIRHPPAGRPAAVGPRRRRPHRPGRQPGRRGRRPLLRRPDGRRHGAAADPRHPAATASATAPMRPTSWASRSARCATS